MKHQNKHKSGTFSYFAAVKILFSVDLLESTKKTSSTVSKVVSAPAV